MNIKEKALAFAISAHMGQVRKSEPDKPMIMHPINAGNILEEYGFDDNVVAACYLHDVVEDTSYTIDDIRDIFGDDIASLVWGNTEPDKSLSWEDRKKHTISNVKNLPLRNKAVVCADKISNLEDLSLLIEKSGVRDFSRFKRGEDQQRWYYTSVYESLISGENKELPMFKRYKEILDNVFYHKENEFLRDGIFCNDLDYYEKLKKLHAYKTELVKLKSLCKLSHPFVVEFSGTPRTGKTTTINNLYDFFRKGGFNVSVLEEFTTSKYYRGLCKNAFNGLTRVDRNIKIVDEVFKQLLDAVHSDSDIVLVDRSLNDRQIWNYWCYRDGDFDENTYSRLRNKYYKLSRELIDCLIITYTSSDVSLKRDYVNSLTLEDRNFLNISNIDRFNSSLKDLIDLFNNSVDSYLPIDTSDLSVRDTGVIACDGIVKAMRKKYINEFKNTNGIK